jgi:Peptidase family M48
MLVTTSAMATMTDEELSAVCLHEFGHLTESQRVRYMRLLGIPLSLVWVAAPAVIGSYGNSSLVACIVLTCAGYALLHQLSQKMEVQADRFSCTHGGTPQGLAQALTKLHEANLMPIVTGTKNQTHPDLYDRLVAVGSEPAYPRPQPPSQGRLRAALAFAMLTGLVGGMWGREGLLYAVGAITSQEHMLQLAVALGGESGEFAALGSFHRDVGDREKAIVFYRTASVLNRFNWRDEALLAQVLVETARCPEARCTR